MLQFQKSLMPITFRGQHIEPTKSDDYQRGLRNITKLKSLSDFSAEEQKEFKGLLVIIRFSWLYMLSPKGYWH